jgi:hypothetical protein
MGSSFAQTLGSAGQQFEDARSKNIAEKQAASELALRQGALAKQLQMEMMRLQLEKAREIAEQGRYAAEQERLKNAGWSKVGQDYQNPDGTWTTIWYNPATGEKRELQVGTPKAAAIQDLKGDQALDLEKLRGKDKLEQIAASGRWHTKWAEIAAQGKLKKEDWNVLKTDPGYIGAVSGMKNALAERNMILSRMYSPTNPPTPDQMKQLNQQLQEVEQRLKQSSDTAEQVRNRIRFKTGGGSGSRAISDLKDLVGAGVGPERPKDVPGNYIYRENGSKGKGWYAPGTN